MSFSSLEEIQTLVLKYTNSSSCALALPVPTQGNHGRRESPVEVKAVQEDAQVPTT